MQVQEEVTLLSDLQEPDKVSHSRMFQHIPSAKSLRFRVAASLFFSDFGRAESFGVSLLVLSFHSCFQYWDGFEQFEALVQRKGNWSQEEVWREGGEEEKGVAKRPNIPELVREIVPKQCPAASRDLHEGDFRCRRGRSRL